MATNRQIYAELERLASPVPAPGTWSQGCALPGFYQAPLDSAGLMRTLRERFPLEELLAARVVRRHVGRPETDALHPDLWGLEKRWLALRRAPEAEPYDLIGDSGCLSGRLPVLAVLDDFRTQSLFHQAETNLLIAYTVPDMASLISAGLPATTAIGLDTLGRSDLDEFCDVFRLVRSFDGAADQSGVGGGIPSGTGEAPSGIPTPPGASSEPVSLSAAVRQDQPAAGTSALPPVPGQVPVLGALVAWSPSLATLETPPKHAAVAAHLRQLSQHLGLSGHQITSWQPTPMALQQIKIARRYGSARELQNILSLSVRRDFLPGSRGGVKKCTTLAAALASCLAEDGDPELQKRRWQNLQKQLERLVYLPLLQQAEESSDPVRISDFVTLAATSQVLHDLLLQTLRKLQTGARKHTQNPPLSREELLCIYKLINLSLLISSKLEPAAVDTAS